MPSKRRRLLLWIAATRALCACAALLLAHDTSSGEASIRFRLVRASVAEQQELLPPNTVWRVASYR